MPILKTKHQRKSAIITAIVLLLSVLLIFNFGMTYLDPPKEYGVAINFGNSDDGKGKPIQETNKATAPKEVEKEEEVVEEVKEILKEIIKEDLITDDTNTEATVVEKTKEIAKKPIEKVTKEKVVQEKPKPKPSKATTDALNNLLNGAEKNGTQQREGTTDKEGVKGSKAGNKNAPDFYGNTTSGNGNTYNLAGRNVVTIPIKKPDCQEEGIVVVRITVNRKGEVIQAESGVKGSTNTADCLRKPAKEAALQTKWNSDFKAPSNQIGTIIYKFSLTQ
ncbi:energy transducer TonB [Polaribacter sp.]|uniref:energy transducer TonB n=1 Tax=Polaribacter sp. TaxID=1920175 RepID=UPI0025F86853|nr:energy transducer TonB [Polaribacter sp.]